MTSALVALMRGDPAGIVPKTVAEPDFVEVNRALVIGDTAILGRAVKPLAHPLSLNVVAGREEGHFTPSVLDRISAGKMPEDCSFGKQGALAGAAAFEYVRRATELALDGSIEAVAIAPHNAELPRRFGRDRRLHPYRRLGQSFGSLWILVTFFILYFGSNGATVFGALFSEQFLTDTRSTGVSSALQNARGLSFLPPIIAGAIFPVYGYAPVVLRDATLFGPAGPPGVGFQGDT